MSFRLSNTVREWVRGANAGHADFLICCGKGATLACTSRGNLQYGNRRSIRFKTIVDLEDHTVRAIPLAPQTQRLVVILLPSVCVARRRTPHPQ